MKYIKLFEQFDEEESWWEEESPFDVVKDLKIIYHAGSCFLAEMKYDVDGSSSVVKLFDDHNVLHGKDIFDFNPKYDGETKISISDSSNKYGTDDSGHSAKGWKYFKYKNLPIEIRNRII